MTNIVTAEMISVFFVFMSLICQLVGHNRSESMKRLEILYIITLAWLVSDILAYLFSYPEMFNTNRFIEHWSFRVMNLMPYILCNCVLGSFLYYCDAFIGEKAKINKWVFRAPILVAFANTFIECIWYYMDELVVCEEGYYVFAGSVPIFVPVIDALLMLYAPFVAFGKSKQLGKRSVVVLSTYSIPTIIAIIYLALTDRDFSVVASAISITFVTTLLQKDIAQKRQLELEEALEYAEFANKAKTNFLFNMSHDVRTPMNAILGFVGMAQKYIDDKEKVKDCLEKTRQSGNLLLTLINSVLDVSKIESGSAEVEEKAGDVFLSFANIESTMQESAAAKDITLTFEFGEINDRYVYADFTRCIRIFTNLISNAIKYTNDGGYVRVICEQASYEKHGVASFRYIIEDNGIGMSKEFQKYMFEAFSRERSSTVSGIQGTGLGLFVCKTFVDYLHGRIECESELGKGTKFIVTLPFRVQAGNNYTDPLTGEVKQSGSEETTKIDRFRNKKILLVEDNELNREIARDILEEEGLIVEDAEDGSVAVDILGEKGPDYYDFILMDIQMPVMNGYEATKAIRAMYPDSSIPIIAVSANAFDEDKKNSKLAGMNDHVAKPININELFAAMAKSL